MSCRICALTALHISSVTSSGETQVALLGNLPQENSTVTQQFHTTMNTANSGQTKSSKVGEMVPPYNYHMLPILLSNSSSLKTELLKNFDSEDKNEDNGILSRTKRFVVVVPLTPALIYGLITRTMGFAVGAGTSEVIRAIKAAAYPSDTKSSDDSKDDSD